MIKRTSILVRRPQDDRATFTAHWSGTHGNLVAKLHGISRYTQNHVLEDFPFSLSGVRSYDIDGFVELYFATEHAMRTAFTGDRVQPVWDDEPNFLEHSTAYQIEGDCEPESTQNHAKLIVVAAGTPEAIDWLTDILSKLPALPQLDRNDVSAVIARATMTRPPQPANTFVHLRFATVKAAQQAAQELIMHCLHNASSRGIERLAVTRVAEHRII